MPAYAPNFTARYIVNYTSLGRRYSVALRFTSSASLPTAGEIAAVKAVLDASNTLRFTDWTVESAEWIAQGSAVSVPVTAPVVTAGTVAVPTFPLAARPGYYGWTGRSFGGSRAGLFLFGVIVAPSAGVQASDWRVTTVENTTVAAVRNALIAQASAGLCAIDGGAIAWKNYANIGFNSYQIRKARGT